MCGVEVAEHAGRICVHAYVSASLGAYLCCIKRGHYAHPNLWGEHNSSLMDLVSKRAKNILKGC